MNGKETVLYDPRFGYSRNYLLCRAIFSNPFGGVNYAIFSKINHQRCTPCAAHESGASAVRARVALTLPAALDARRGWRASRPVAGFARARATAARPTESPFGFLPLHTANWKHKLSSACTPLVRVSPRSRDATLLSSSTYPPIIYGRSLGRLRSSASSRSSLAAPSRITAGTDVGGITPTSVTTIVR
jgi:hypothetical protein